MSAPSGSTPADAARSALRKAQREQDARHMGQPSLHLLIWPAPGCVRLSLVIYYSQLGMRRTCKVLRQAEWNPREVTEQTLIDWGQRALASYLADHPELNGGTQPRG